VAGALVQVGRSVCDCVAHMRHRPDLTVGPATAETKGAEYDEYIARFSQYQDVPRPVVGSCESAEEESLLATQDEPLGPEEVRNTPQIAVAAGAQGSPHNQGMPLPPGGPGEQVPMPPGGISELMPRPPGGALEQAGGQPDAPAGARRHEPSDTAGPKPERQGQPARNDKASVLRVDLLGLGAEELFALLGDCHQDGYVVAGLQDKVAQINERLRVLERDVTRDTGRVERVPARESKESPRSPLHVGLQPTRPSQPVPEASTSAADVCVDDLPNTVEELIAERDECSHPDGRPLAGLEERVAQVNTKLNGFGRVSQLKLSLDEARGACQRQHALALATFETAKGLGFQAHMDRRSRKYNNQDTYDQIEITGNKLLKEVRELEVLASNESELATQLNTLLPRNEQITPQTYRVRGHDDRGWVTWD
jgi:hypothetical protein